MIEAPCKKISGQTYTTTTGYNAKGELTSYTYPDGTAVGRIGAMQGNRLPHHHLMSDFWVAPSAGAPQELGLTALRAAPYTQ